MTRKYDAAIVAQPVISEGQPKMVGFAATAAKNIN